MRRAVTAATALLALSATAFAPVSSATSDDAATAFAPTRTVTVDGVELEVVFDQDDDQPTVLLVADASYLDEHHTLLSDGGRYTVALLDLGCGDVGGPQDTTAVAEVARFLAGQRTDDDGAQHRGSGDVALYGVGIGGLQGLLAAATDPGRAALTAVAVEDAWVDPYDAAYLGGVERVGDATDPLDPTAAPATFPCELGGATDGTRDGWFAARDATAVVGALDLPLSIGHRYESAVPLRQSHALSDAVLRAFDTDDGTLRMTNQWFEDEIPGFADPGDEGTRDFLRATIDPLQRIRDEAERDLHSRGAGYGAPGESCLLCAGTQANGDVGVLDRDITEVTYFLNRTFEQDLDCTPVCVPGPGTGEIGSLEDVNRFEAPWAPVFTWADAGVDSELLTYRDPLNDGSGNELGDDSLPGGHGYHSLAFRTQPFEDWMTVVGTVRVEGVFDTGSAGGTITPLLTAVDEDGRARLLARGAFDLDFAAGLDAREHVSGWKLATIEFDAGSFSVREGERLEVILQSQNVGAFAPGNAQGTVNVATGPVDGVTDAGTTLHVPFLETFWSGPAPVGSGS